MGSSRLFIHPHTRTSSCKTWFDLSLQIQYTPCTVHNKYRFFFSSYLTWNQLRSLSGNHHFLTRQKRFQRKQTLSRFIHVDICWKTSDLLVADGYLSDMSLNDWTSFNNKKKTVVFVEQKGSLAQNLCWGPSSYYLLLNAYRKSTEKLNNLDLMCQLVISPIAAAL